MEETHHTTDQIICKLKTAEELLDQGKSVADVWGALEVAQRTYHGWRELYVGMQVEDANS